jgi:hypothetical protein
MILGYGIAKVGASFFNEFRNAVFGKVVKKKIIFFNKNNIKNK